MTEEDEENFKFIDAGRSCEKEKLSDKVCDHGHLTGKCRDLAHCECNINVTQDKSNMFPFIIHNFCNYDCHLFFKKIS